MGLTRRTHMRRTNTLTRSPFKPKKGCKVRWWERTRAGLKKEFAARNIVTCEARFEGCTVDDQLSFAHSHKRRHITDETLMLEVALLCWNCHLRLEVMGEAKMCIEIRKIIERRAYRLAEEAA
jgi:hypothetical protein